ncbi:MAG: hypothetical protein ACLTYN_00990 [Dysosmobacter welbionis]
MLTPQELKKAPCFRTSGTKLPADAGLLSGGAAELSLDEVIYDFSGPAGNAVGVVERRHP